MNSDNFSYYMPTRVIFGCNSISEIDRYINGRRALLITSQGFVKRGFVVKIQSLTNKIIGVLSEVDSHPEFKDVKVIYNKARRIDYDVILALGGGSVMDVAKFVSVQNNNRDYSFVEGLAKGLEKSAEYKVTPIISIPTTSGTGSEVTPFSTIWDMTEKKKYSLHLPDLMSELAIYDPMLTITVPKDITIHTGLDTLSHALESIWNKNANPITIGYAIKAAKLVLDNLVKLSDDLKNIEYRNDMMKASMFAGLAFSNTQTAMAHAISYYITSHKGVPHGIACSFTLPMLMDNIIGKYGFVDDALRDIFGDLSSSVLRSMLHELNVSTDFIDYDINSSDLEEIKKLVQNHSRADNSLVSFNE
jgi:phosphonate metabolism-associated iron-containing alcohol dehydrogenase